MLKVNIKNLETLIIQNSFTLFFFINMYVCMYVYLHRHWGVKKLFLFTDDSLICCLITKIKKWGTPRAKKNCSKAQTEVITRLLIYNRLYIRAKQSIFFHMICTFVLNVIRSVPWWWSSRRWLRLSEFWENHNRINKSVCIVLVMLQVLVGRIIKFFRSRLSSSCRLCENK